jgi:ABC-type uncharacterized transport system YnjBCD ATPase subunit
MARLRVLGQSRRNVHALRRLVADGAGIAFAKQVRGGAKKAVALQSALFALTFSQALEDIGN